MKKAISILIVVVFALNSCKKNLKVDITIDDNFLSSHEWLIDTIYGDKKFIQDWVYFTPKKEFYRFSKYRKSYIVDSALTWSHNQVMKENHKIFTITPIDSQFIEITGVKNIYRAKRWNKFDSMDIKLFINNNDYKLKINGKWRLDSMEIEKARMPSFCKEITAGSIFEFKDEGRLLVYQRDSLNACNTYSYRIYKNEISLIEWDMIMKFPIEKLEENSLTIKSKYVAKDKVWTEETMKARREGFRMYFNKVTN